MWNRASPSWPRPSACTSPPRPGWPRRWSGPGCCPGTAAATGSGLETIRLGTLALRGLDFVDALRPAMEELSRQTGETINLAIPDGSGILNVAEIPATFILSCSSGWIGRRTRPHAVANGKVLLAYGTIPVPARLERYTEQTITDPAALAAELAAVRADGYATAVGELEDGLVAVATPGLRRDGRLHRGAVGLRAGVPHAAGVPGRARPPLRGYLGPAPAEPSHPPPLPPHHRPLGGRRLHDL